MTATETRRHSGGETGGKRLAEGDRMRNGWRHAATTRAVIVGLAVAVGLGGCGTTPDHTVLPLIVVAPSALAADGSVPFVDEPAGLHEFDIPAPVDLDPGDARSCKATQLTGELADWIRKGAGGTEPGRRPPPGLFGYVRVTLRSGKPCTLQGLVSARLLIDGQPAPVQYSNGVIQQAQDRVTLVTADRAADLRIDWSPPYCGPTGTQAFAVTLPHQGGTLDAPVLRPMTTVCSGASSETDANLRTYVSISAFTPHVEPTSEESPLRFLRATLLDAPTTARAGETLHFRVRLTNSSADAVSLSPCPGYSQERFILGAGDRSGFNTGQVYRLNCRPLRSIPGHAFVDFQMRAQVPDDPPGGPTFSVTWRLIAPYLPGRQDLTCAFRVPL